MTRRSAPSMLICGAAALVASGFVAGCGADSPSDTTTRGVTPVVTTSGTPTPGPIDPADALARAGLALPANASDAKAVTRDVADSLDLEAYVITFSLPRSNAIGFCDSGDLGGDIPAVRLSEQEQTIVGADVTVGDQSRLCTSVWPANTAWNRVVVIDAGDPAVVHVGVTKMGR